MKILIIIVRKVENRWNNYLWHVRSKHHISIIKNVSSIDNYKEGYWDGVDGGKNEADVGDNDYCDVSVVSVLKLTMTIV